MLLVTIRFAVQYGVNRWYIKTLIQFLEAAKADRYHEVQAPREILRRLNSTLMLMFLSLHLSQHYVICIRVKQARYR